MYCPRCKLKIINIPDSGLCPRCDFELIHKEQIPNTETFCPECNSPTIHAEGCETCPACGWGKCG